MNGINNTIRSHVFHFLLIADKILCLSFVYCMYGEDMGDLSVIQTKNNSSKVIVYRSGNQRRMWHPVELNIFSDGFSKV